MNPFILYMILNVIAAGIFYAGYIALLRNEPLFRFNRFYLLASVLLSVLIPIFIFVPSFAGIPAMNTSISRLPAFTLPEINLSTGKPGFDFSFLIKAAYLTVVILLTIRLIIRFWVLRKIALSADAESTSAGRVLWCDAEIQPFSFWHTTYMPMILRNDADIEKILNHEKIHVQSWHSLDILLLQLAQIGCWLNPFIMLIEKSLREIHEFEADQAVIRDGTDPEKYTRILFSQNRETAAIVLGNNFNYSSIKRRLIMFYKKETRFAWLKSASTAVICLGIVFFLAIGCRQSVDKTSTAKAAIADSMQTSSAPKTAEAITQVPPPPDEPPPPPPVPPATELKSRLEKMPQFPGGQEALVKFLASHIRYPEEGMKKGIQGAVMTNFIVKADGSIGDVKIEQGLGKAFDDEAIRVIRLMPKWKPGMDKGVPVDTRFEMPIRFALK